MRGSAARVVTAVATVILVAGLAASPVVAQAPPPDAVWLEFETENFRVIFHDGLEELARHAAAVAERTWILLRSELDRVPRGPVEMVVTDHVDFSNGLATPFTRNRIVVYARPPAGVPSLGFSRDWLELVVAHELVHIFHLDPAGPVGRAVRSVFGRIPIVWPLFPAVGTPIWNMEGVATYYESVLTGGGRVHGTYHDMVIRAAALEAEIPRLRQVSTPSPVFPGGERSYVYGAALMEWITEQYGPEAHPALFDATYGSVLPTFLFFDHVARRALGRPFSAIYDDWRRSATRSARALADSLAAEGLTASETVARRDPYAVAPRISPDGLRLSYAGHDFRSDAVTELMDFGTGEVVQVAPRNQFGMILGPASWLPDGSGLVFAQLEYQGRYRLYSDLWLAGDDGRPSRRLTRHQRLAQPDVAPDGRRVAAVQVEDGAVHLVEYDMAEGTTRTISPAAPGEAFDSPRWCPDGRRIAVSRFAGGRLNVVVVDAATGQLSALTDADAMDGSPAWSSDGRWVLFWSDRTGVPNLFAAPAPAVAPTAPGQPDRAPDQPESLWQVTNVVTGAFDPEMSPDGGSIFFVGYGYTGWRIERMAFDTTAWRPAAPPAVHYQPSLLPPPAGPVGEAQAPLAPDMTTGPEDGDVFGGPAQPYNALPGALPRFWAPTFEVVGSTETGQWNRFLGIHSLGWDVLRRHSWSGSAAYDIDTGRLGGGIAWTWAGLGNPDLSLSARRVWSGAGWLELAEDLQEAVLERQDRVSLSAVFWRRQWRNTAWLALGSDMEREQFQARRLSTGELTEAGIRLRELPTTASITARPGFSNVRQHPYSISRQDGFTTSIGLGRWWNVTDGRIAYDQVLGSLAAFRGHRLWGFADHVTAIRIAGLRRTGDDARTTSIGGTPGGTPDLWQGTIGAGPFLPVRGFRSGERFGTRAWIASTEYRFPLHMTGAPQQVLGFSLTSVAGALFADAGHAWCSEQERARDRFHRCPRADQTPLVSVGAEMALTLGVLHSIPLSVRYGIALPVAGTDLRRPVLHIGAGPSF